MNRGGAYLALALAMGGCGCVSDAEAASTKVVAILGDSISLNYGDELQTLLGSSYYVVNFAVGGTQTYTIQHSQWEPSVLPCHYYAAVVMGGVNDIRGSEALSYTQLHLGGIYAQAGAVGHFFAATITPTPGNGPGNSWTDITNPAIPARNDWIRSQAVGAVNLIDTWAAFGGASPDMSLYGADNVHPDNDGDAVLAGAVATAVLAL